MYLKPYSNLIWFIFECGFEIGKENRKRKWKKYSRFSSGPCGLLSLVRPATAGPFPSQSARPIAFPLSLSPVFSFPIASLAILSLNPSRVGPLPSLLSAEAPSHFTHRPSRCFWPDSAAARLLASSLCCTGPAVTSHRQPGPTLSVPSSSSHHQCGHRRVRVLPRPVSSPWLTPQATEPP